MDHYEKKYKEALERMELCVRTGLRIDPGYIFPELNESEDERIRKELISYFKQFANEELRGVNISDWISWLEKQGEQKPAWSEEDEAMLSKVIKDNDVRREAGIITQDYHDKVEKWLKSLKDRHTWKPSDKQMDCLCETLNKSTDNVYDGLKSLFDELQKLK